MSVSSPPWPRSMLLVTAATLAVGAGGGTTAFALGMPVGWLAGSMVAVAAAAIAGVPVAVPPIVRPAVFVVLGISIGSAVHAETLDRLSQWPASLAALAVATATVTAVVYRYLSTRPGWDRRSAFYASVPGALSLMVAMAAATGADVRRVALVQSLRLFLLVAVLPLVVDVGGGPAPTGLAPAAVASPPGVVLLVAAAVAASVLARVLRLPLPALLGSLVASAVLHASDVVSGRLPDAVLAVGMIAVGALIGSRFASADGRLLRTVATSGPVACSLSFAVAAAFAALVSVMLGLPLTIVLLAFAPGGIEAMTYMALALGLDPAYVAGHHVARIVVLTLVMPLVAPLVARRWGKDGDR